MISLRKLLLKEDLVGEMPNGVEVYKNPKSIKRMKKDLRGISTPKGDLFVADDNSKIIHSHFANWLDKNGNLGERYSVMLGSKAGILFAIEDGYIPWQRKGSSDSFYLSESIDFDDTKSFNEKELMPYLEKYTKKVKSKNPKYKFVLKGVYK
jgi:hypothetical protein